MVVMVEHDGRDAQSCGNVTWERKVAMEVMLSGGVGVCAKVGGMVMTGCYDRFGGVLWHDGNLVATWEGGPGWLWVVAAAVAWWC